MTWHQRHGAWLGQYRAGLQGRYQVHFVSLSDQDGPLYLCLFWLQDLYRQKIFVDRLKRTRCSIRRIGVSNLAYQAAANRGMSCDSRGKINKATRGFKHLPCQGVELEVASRFLRTAYRAVCNSQLP